MAPLKKLIFDDLYRYTGSRTLGSFFTAYYKLPGFNFMFWFRTASYFRSRNKILYAFFWMRVQHRRFKYGFEVSPGSLIGPGFYIGHIGGVVISPSATIGKNCNISQGVTIGFNSRGKRKGHPTIKDSVYIGPGAVIIGSVTIEKNAAIGANAVVTKDVPENAVVAGVPAKIISYKGSEGYIINEV